MTKMTIFEAIATDDLNLVIAVVDPAFRTAAEQASARVRAKGIRVADGRATEKKETG